MCIPVTMWVCAILHTTIVYFECSIYVVSKTMEISVSDCVSQYLDMATLQCILCY